VAFNDAHPSCKPNLLLASRQTIYISQQGAKSVHAPQEPQVAGDGCGGREGIRRLEDERAREEAGPKSTRSRIVKSGNSDGGIVERRNIGNENIGDKIVE
jgi:hypothetical protein